MSAPSPQASFAAAVQDPASPVPDGVVSHRGDADAKRFAVYRNNVHVGLVGVLAAKFPVCAQLVGEAFFSAMARIYVAEHKPASPVMMHYGTGFADFIAGFARANTVPYLADIARLEQAWSTAYNAADVPALAIAQLADLAPQALLETVLPRHPASSLIISGFPVGSIWSAHQTPGLTVRPGAETVLLTRPQADVKVTVIPPSDAAFIAGLFAGRAIGPAAEHALTDHPGFDLAQALTGLCALGAFASPSEGKAR